VTARRGAAGTVGAVLIALVVLLADGRVERAWTEFKTPAAAKTESDPAARLSNLNSLRYELWKTAGDAWTEHPLDGVGPGTYEFWWDRHATSPLTVRDAHSLYIENLAELGLGGLVAILLFSGGLVVLAFRGRSVARTPPEIGIHTGLIVGAVVFFAHAGIDWLWESTAVGVLGVICAAVAAASASTPAVAGLRPLWRVPLVVAAIGLSLIQLPGMVSTLREREATDALAQGDTSGAVGLSTEALDAEPWAASPLALRAQVLQRMGRLRAARADLDRAIDAEPNNWRHWFLLARLEAVAGRTPEAVAALSEARRLNPLAPELQ
jgi:O-antigen ligase